MGIKLFASNRVGYRLSMRKHCENIIVLLNEEQSILEILKGEEPNEEQSNRLAEIKYKVASNITQLNDQNVEWQK